MVVQAKRTLPTRLPNLQVPINWPSHMMTQSEVPSLRQLSTLPAYHSYSNQRVFTCTEPHSTKPLNPRFPRRVCFEPQKHSFSHSNKNQFPVHQKTTHSRKGTLASPPYRSQSVQQILRHDPCRQNPGQRCVVWSSCKVSETLMLVI